MARGKTNKMRGKAKTGKKGMKGKSKAKGRGY